MKTPTPDIRTVVSKAVNDAAENVVSGVNTVVKPAAAASVASTFSFPVGLMVFVLLFLFVQPHADRRESKLRGRPRSSVESDLVFQEEDVL